MSEQKGIEAFGKFARNNGIAPKKKGVEGYKEFAQNAMGVEPLEADMVQEDDTVSRFKIGVDIANDLAAAANRGIVGTLDIPALMVNLASEAVGSDFRLGYFTDLSGSVLEGTFLDEAMKGREFDDEIEDIVAPIRTGVTFLAGGMAPSAAAKAVVQTTGTTVKGIQGAKLSEQSMATGRAGAIPVGSKGVRPTMKESIQSGDFLGRELKNSALFAAGGTVGSAWSDGDPLWELAGGLLGATRLAPAKLAVNATKQAWEGGKQIVSSSARSQTAVESILKHSLDPDQAVKNLKKNIKAGKEGTLAQMTLDEGLAAFENAMLKRSKKDLPLKIKASDTRMNDNLFKQLDEMGDGELKNAAKDFFKAEIAANKAILEQGVNQAVKKAKFARDNVGTPLATSDASVMLSGALDDTMKSYRQVEGQAWDEVPNSLVDGSRFIMNLRRNMKKNLGTSTALDDALEGLEPVITRFEKQLAKSKDGTIDVKELIDLRSLAMDTVRNMPREGKTRFKRYGFDLFQRALMRNIEKGGTGPAYKRATALTRQFHETFSEGPLASIRGDKVIPETVGDKLFTTGASGRAKADALLTVGGKYPNVTAATDDLIKAKFQTDAIGKDGLVNVVAGDRFMAKHGEFLATRPQLKAQLDEAINSQNYAAGEKLAADKYSKSVIDKSRMANFSNVTDPDMAVDALIKGQYAKPREAARELVEQAKRDPSGDALRGLQRNTIDSLMRNISTTSGGSKELMIPHYQRVVKRMEPVLEEVFDKKQRKLMKDILKDGERLFLRKNAPTSYDEITQNLMLITAGKIAGARLGAKVGTSPLIAAGLGGKIVEKVASRIPRSKTTEIMEEMILNPELFKQSLKNVPHVRTIEQATSLVNGWIIMATKEASNWTEEEKKLTQSGGFVQDIRSMSKERSGEIKRISERAAANGVL